MKKKIFAVLISAILALSFVGCIEGGGGGGESPLAEIYASVPEMTTIAPSSFDVSGESGSEFTIGISMVTMSADFFRIIADYAEAQLREYGVEVLVQGAESDVAQQVSQIEDFLAQGVDLLIVNSASPPSALNLVLERAFEEGVPVIAMDSHLDPEAPFLTYIGASNWELGVQVGQHVATYLIDKYGTVRGNLAVIAGDPGNIAGQQRGDGFMYGIASVQEDHELVQVARQYGYWSEEDGMEAVENILVAHPYIDVIFTYSDNMAVGGFTAAQRAGRDEMIFAGINGSTPAMRVMLEHDGFIYALGQNDPIIIGTLTAQLAMLYLETGYVPSRTILTQAVVISPANVNAHFDPDRSF